MTVSGTHTATNTKVDEIVRVAMRRAGLMPAGMDITSTNYAPIAQSAREHLQAIIDEISARGATMRTVRFQNVQLTAADYTYTLGAEVLDVIGDGMYIGAGEDVTQAPGETLVRQFSQSEWHRLSSKDASGRPTAMLPYRGGSQIELRLWPIPDEAGVVRIRAHVRSYDAVYGQYDVDMEPYWVSYLQFEVASRLADDASLDQKAMVLHAKAEKLFPHCKNKSQSRVADAIQVGHNTGWNC